MPTKVETKEDWLVDEDTDGEGDGDEAVELHKGVEQGKLRATKCSWLQITRKKSNCAKNRIIISRTTIIKEIIPLNS